MTRYLPQTAAFAFAWVVTHALWLATLAPAVG